MTREREEHTVPASNCVMERRGTTAGIVASTSQMTKCGMIKMKEGLSGTSNEMEQSWEELTRAATSNRKYPANKRCPVIVTWTDISPKCKENQKFNVCGGKDRTERPLNAKLEVQRTLWWGKPEDGAVEIFRATHRIEDGDLKSPRSLFAKGDGLIWSNNEAVRGWSKSTR
ncbi:hypothetical protein BV22DRAFT_1045639 [Leucogyrophana mollusca]|uniref:Uncharacterized protein n=1 Tax=Leucogyrophana mollusca TaxID=85980 RepID=A0ACB8BNA4_9AGAM|nr:hypothetical protein BV22DRAFT_1045639 [Leucogyrophana mollusca]